MQRIVHGTGKFYTYVLRWNDGTYYVGSKTGKNTNHETFLKPRGYHTSSNLVKEKISDIGYPMKCVIRLFENPSEAYEYETRLLRRIGARKNPKLLNMHENNMPFFTTKLNGEGNPFYGKKHTEDSMRRAKETRLKNNGGVYHVTPYILSDEGRDTIREKMILNNPMSMLKNDAKKMQEMQSKRRETLSSFEYWHQKHFVEKYENWEEMEFFTIELIKENKCFPFHYVRKYGLTEAKARTIVDGFDRKYKFKYKDGKLRKLPGRIKNEN